MARQPTTWAVAATISFACALPIPSTVAAADSAVVLMYHRVADGGSDSTRIPLDLFAQHIGELTSGAYAVLPIPEIVDALRHGRDLPDRTVGISFDDAYASVHAAAWPRLKAAGLPFTVFVGTGRVDRGAPDSMSWAEVRALAEDGVTIGNRTDASPHLASLPPAQAKSEIVRANTKLTDRLGMAPTLFAYPYGEYNLAIRDVVAAAGFAAAFGQQSGVAHGGSDPYAMPRFVLNARYGDMSRLRRVAGALPLPVEDVSPLDPVVGEHNPPNFGFSVLPGIGGLSALACYASGQGAVQVERLGDHRFEVRLAAPFPPGRSRINCTLPAGNGRWRWYGRQFLVLRP